MPISRNWWNWKGIASFRKALLCSDGLSTVPRLVPVLCLTLVIGFGTHLSYPVWSNLKVHNLITPEKVLKRCGIIRTHDTRDKVCDV